MNPHSLRNGLLPHTQGNTEAAEGDVLAWATVLDQGVVVVELL
jgi:hypothetical protein